MSTEKEQLESLSHRYDLGVAEIDRLQAENKRLQEEIIALNERLLNAQRNVDINKEIVRNNLTSTNQMKDDFAREIEILRKKISILEK